MCKLAVAALPFAMNVAPDPGQDAVNCMTSIVLVENMGFPQIRGLGFKTSGLGYPKAKGSISGLPIIEF